MVTRLLRKDISLRVASRPPQYDEHTLGGGWLSLLAPFSTQRDLGTSMQCQKDLGLMILFATCLAIFVFDPNAVSLAVAGALFLAGVVWCQYKHNSHSQPASAKREQH